MLILPKKVPLQAAISLPPPYCFDRPCFVDMEAKSKVSFMSCQGKRQACKKQAYDTLIRHGNTRWKQTPEHAIPNPECLT